MMCLKENRIVKKWFNVIIIRVSVDIEVESFCVKGVIL